MQADPTIGYLVGTFVVLLISFKVLGSVLFWLLSFILGNKLAALLEESDARDSVIDSHPAPTTTPHKGVRPRRTLRLSSHPNTPSRRQED